MPCYHPIKAFIVGKTEDGKKILRFTGHDVETYYRREIDPIEVHTSKDYILLPCGKCIGCKIKRSAEWATRMMLELKEHEKACFITLTYSDEYLPLSKYVDENGEEQISFTLRKKHYQDFMKRLRKHYEPKKIRFFACGEYGSKSLRPHYHAIIYGIDFSEDRYIWNTTEEGYVSWRSETLERLWTYGYSMINEVNYNTCAYVARYVQKKHYGAHNIYYQTFNIVPEFNLMSRRPGIAHDYYENHKEEIYENQEIFLSNLKGGLKVCPPRYFDKLYEIDYPDEMEQIKEYRKEMSKNAMDLKLSKTNLNLLEMLEIEERNFTNRIKTLKREKV